MRFRNLAVAGLAAAGLVLSSVANAATISLAGAPDSRGNQASTLFSSFGNALKFTFVSKDANFTSDLNLVYNNQFIFNNNTAAGTMVTVNGPMSGAEILMSIFVNNTSNTWYSGNPTQNADGIVHAMITALGNGVFRVAFEDLFIGRNSPEGEPDFNDFVFTVQEVPVPGAALLLLSGIAGLGFASRRKAAV